MNALRAIACFIVLLAGAGATNAMNLGTVSITSRTDSLQVEFRAPDIEADGRTLFVALDTDPLSGCALIPYAVNSEGSTIFLPFRADVLLAVRCEPGGKIRAWARRWSRMKWSEPEALAIDATRSNGSILISFTPDALPVNVAVWAKDMTAHGGWGELIPTADGLCGSGGGDRTIGAYALQKSGAFLPAGAAERTRIYQLLPRLFGNTNETRKPNGTIAENGVGKFADINERALSALRDELGITHIWLTGVLAQATSVDYSAIGKPADDPDLLKGLAGSPYAIKDTGDVCPDYALEPAKRMEEFRQLVGRIHAAGMKVIIDFVPNHVARSHASTVATFGASDDRSRFFSPANNFFWLQKDSPGGGPPLRLPTVRNGEYLSPTCRMLGAGDGLFLPEMERGRVTGNNVASWSPDRNDWYETVKLNYGYDFTTGRRSYPHAAQPEISIPDTWWKMDAVIAHWQAIGVDGFRCDMAHMVPPEFWQWSVARARLRQSGVMFVAEAYNNDPMKVEGGDTFVAGFKNVMLDLLNAGFDAVYDDPSYKSLKRIYDGSAWANDLDGSLGVREGRVQQDYVFRASLHYAENHDEVRLASRGNWGNHGAEVGPAVSAVLWGLSHGPMLIYCGQEVGEPANGSEGFGGDDGRTSIFDYWTMPEFSKWVNGHRYDGDRLSQAQKSLRERYGKLLKIYGEPAFRDGDFISLNGANSANEWFGRLPGDHASGHWLYAFARVDIRTGQRFVVAVNLHPTETMHAVRIIAGGAAIDALALAKGKAVDRFGNASATVDATGIEIPAIPPATPVILEIQTTNSP
ncbi:MAG: hypothetical protein RL088_848 [Verrucomicrobiota bacterium]